MTDAEIREILEAGELDRLLGQFESASLECKRQPYQLDSVAGKIELAKDVAGLANAKGGLILLGVATRRDADHHEDQIERIRGFQRSLVDTKQYQQILRTWLYPPIPDLHIEWFPSTQEPQTGIVAIQVPELFTGNRPVLTTCVVAENGRRFDALVGYHERKQAEVTHLTTERLQGLLRDGLRFDSLMGEQLEAIRAAISPGGTPIVDSPPAASEGDPTGVDEGPPARPRAARRIQTEDQKPASVLLEDRISEAVTAVGLAGQPAYALAAIPLDRVEIPNLFRSSEEPIVKLLEHPEELRDGGFDLDTNSRSRIIKGQLRRSSIEDYKSLELWRDGTVIFIARGDQNHGLCWGRTDRQRDAPLINQLVLIEMALLFSTLAANLYRSVGQVGEVAFHLEMRDMVMSGHVARLEPGALDSMHFPGDENAAPDGTFSTDVSATPGDDPPGRIAFQLVSEVYAWFGFDHSRIPYKTDGEKGPEISADKILEYVSRN